MHSLLFKEINDYRGSLGTLFNFDWISIPLVYTQVTASRVNAGVMKGKKHYKFFNKFPRVLKHEKKTITLEKNGGVWGSSPRYNTALVNISERSLKSSGKTLTYTLRHFCEMP